MNGNEELLLLGNLDCIAHDDVPALRILTGFLYLFLEMRHWHPPARAHGVFSWSLLLSIGMDLVLFPP